MRILSYVITAIAFGFAGVVLGILMAKPEPRRRLTFMLQFKLKPNTLIKIVPANVQLDGNPVSPAVDDFSYSLESTLGGLGSIVKDADGDWAIQTGDVGSTGTITGNVTFEGATGSAQAGLELDHEGEITFEFSFKEEAAEGGATPPEGDTPPPPPSE